MENNWHPDFEQAIGEAFGNHISPPIPFEDASPNECCEVLWEVLGTNFTPTILASLHDSQIELLATAFGRYFECESPSEDQIKNAIADSLARWPPGSLGE